MPTAISPAPNMNHQTPDGSTIVNIIIVPSAINTRLTQQAPGGLPRIEHASLAITYQYIICGRRGNVDCVK